MCGSETHSFHHIIRNFTSRLHMFSPVRLRRSVRLQSWAACCDAIPPRAAARSGSCVGLQVVLGVAALLGCLFCCFFGSFGSLFFALLGSFVVIHGVGEDELEIFHAEV